MLRTDAFSLFVIARLQPWRSGFLVYEIASADTRNDNCVSSGVLKKTTTGRRERLPVRKIRGYDFLIFGISSEVARGDSSEVEEKMSQSYFLLWIVLSRSAEENCHEADEPF